MTEPILRNGSGKPEYCPCRFCGVHADPFPLSWPLRTWQKQQDAPRSTPPPAVSSRPWEVLGGTQRSPGQALWGEGVHVHRLPTAQMLTVTCALLGPLGGLDKVSHPGRVARWVGTSSHPPKGCGFDSPSRGVWQATHKYFSLCLSPASLG